MSVLNKDSESSCRFEFNIKLEVYNYLATLAVYQYSSSVSRVHNREEYQTGMSLLSISVHAL